ncbi:hypothetical protein B296_00006878 [Ensete ventricosum]|uniref:Uncharacterized protein n=1 Tax=Ensete ventricosum TaxID=4639 RepID=A0A427B3Z9_ENSVE|nr:hypothetical protein B296_00006878 [Ensete ventricosum]
MGPRGAHSRGRRCAGGWGTAFSVGLSGTGFLMRDPFGARVSDPLRGSGSKGEGIGSGKEAGPVTRAFGLLRMRARPTSCVLVFVPLTNGFSPSPYPQGPCPYLSQITSASGPTGRFGGDVLRYSSTQLQLIRIDVDYPSKS